MADLIDALRVGGVLLGLLGAAIVLYEGLSEPGETQSRMLSIGEDTMYVEGGGTGDDSGDSRESSSALVYAGVLLVVVAVALEVYVMSQGP